MFVRFFNDISGRFLKIVLSIPLLPGQVFLIFLMILLMSWALIGQVNSGSVLSILRSAVLYGVVLCMLLSKKFN